MPTAEELRALEQILRGTLEREGVPATLRLLNARTRHRFTAVYRFEPPWLRNVCTFDRENPDLTLTADSRIRESYCSYVFERAERFAVEDAAVDPQVVGHPKREALLAYCGVPVLDHEGACIGTLCHFDPRPRLMPSSELPLLERAAALVAPWVASAAHQARRASGTLPRTTQDDFRIAAPPG